MMVFSKKEKIRKMTDNLMKIELLDNSQINNDRNTPVFKENCSS